MFFIGSAVLFCLFLQHRSNCQHLNDVVQSALEYYRGRSVVLILDENHSDLFTFITQQKRLSSGKNLFFSSVATLNSLSQNIRTNCESPRDTVVVWNPSDRFPPLLEKVFNETDIPTVKWFVMTSTLTPQTFDNVTIPINREFTVAHGNPESGYTLTEVYDIRPGKKWRNTLGRWSVQPQPLTDLYKRRGNFRGAVFRVMSPRSDPCGEASFAEVVMIVWCIHQKMWEAMAEMLNARTELQVDPNLSMDTITRADVDLTLRSAYLDGVELNTRDFVWPIFVVKIEAYQRYQKQEVMWETYILPFREQMWSVILVWVVLWDFILAFVAFVHSVAVSSENKSFVRCCRELSFTTAFAFSNQDIFCRSKLSSVRILSLMMFIVPSVLFPGYSAVLTSFLTVQLDKRPFQSLEEMSRNKEFKLGYHKNFSLEHLFNLKNLSPLDAALLQNNVLPRDQLPATDEEAIKRMCDEKFSYLSIGDTLLALKPDCRYYELKQHFKVLFESIELKKNGWYKYFLDRCGRDLSFSGVTHRIKLGVVMALVEYNNKITINGAPPPIKLNNIVLPFVVLLLGVIASGVLLLLEVMWFKFNRVQVNSSLRSSSAEQHELYEFVL